jgi:hypothetical protein
MAMADRFVIRTGDSFDVIEGVKLNTEPLTRAEADRLAHEGKSDKLSNLEIPRGTTRGKESPASLDDQGIDKDPAAQSAPQPAPAVDLRTTRADQAGGSCGFKIKGSPTW